MLEQLNHSNVERVKMTEFELLKKQIKKTLLALETKYQESHESIIREYIDKYSSVLSNLERDQSASNVLFVSKSLLNCTRGYMEVSSNYQQTFLIEMSKIEKMIKDL